MAFTAQSLLMETNGLLQAITEMVRRLRQGSGRNGLILANGGVLSYQHALCLAANPSKQQTGYPDSRRFESAPPEPIPPIASEAEGRAKVEVRDTSLTLVLSFGAYNLLKPSRHIQSNLAEMEIHIVPTSWVVYCTTIIAFWRTMATRRRSANCHRLHMSPSGELAWSGSSQRVRRDKGGTCSISMAVPGYSGRVDDIR